MAWDTLSPKRTIKDDTTLSLAMNPEIRAVQILQSPRPRGAMMGAIQPATMARMLSFSSVTMEKLVSKVLRSHIITVATRITEKALWRKSFAFSQRSWNTFLALGIL